MGEARETLDRLTAAVMSGDAGGVAAAYAPDAVVSTPDAGELSGTEAITEYFSTFWVGLSDLAYEVLAKHEAGNVAVDEGFLTGVHTGNLPGPDGAVIAPTGRPLRLRSADVAVVENGRITAHRMYFDQAEFAAQLGLG